MKELWEQAIALLPKKSLVGQFYIEYKPWIKDKTHLYRVAFSTTGIFQPRIYEKLPYPGYITGFGATPEEALQNFITKWEKYD